MEIEVKNEKENTILERKDVELIVDHPGESTPSENNIRSKIAAERDLKKEAILIESIYSHFGTSTSNVFVKILENPEDFVEIGENEEESEEAEKSEEGSEKKKIKVEKEEPEEKSGKEKQSESEEVEEGKTEESESEEKEEADYEDIVKNSISDVKSDLEGLNEVDYEKLLEAEENNKDRKTFKNWIESKMEE